MVTTDAWYASKENLKFLKEKGLGVLMGIAKNRSCSINGRDYTQVKNLEIPEEGLMVHLKSFGKVKVFRKTFKNEDSRYYIMYVPDEDALISISRTEFKATTGTTKNFRILIAVWHIETGTINYHDSESV